MNISGINCSVIPTELHYMGRLKLYDIKKIQCYSPPRTVTYPRPLYADCFYVMIKAKALILRNSIELKPNIYTTQHMVLFMI